MSSTKISVTREYIDCEKIDISLEQLQLYDLSIDFPAYIILVSNSFTSWYQNVNKQYVQLSKAHKFFAVRIFKFRY